jgi:hypothetical protein
VLKLVSTLGRDRAFDPETIEILVAALEEAWKAVPTSDASVGSERYVESAREILAQSIIDDATRGERGQHTLAHSALLKLAHSNLAGKPHIDPRNYPNPDATQ